MCARNRYKAVGVSLAVASGVFIGVSFVLKKKGLLAANLKDGKEAGEGYGYLRNAWWWTGMILSSFSSQPTASPEGWATDGL
jgi:hypothetical protein